MNFELKMKGGVKVKVLIVMMEMNLNQIMKFNLTHMVHNVWLIQCGVSMMHLMEQRNIRNMLM